MRITRIYQPGPLTAGAAVTLEERAAKHLVQVLRLQPGAELVLFDGRGGEYQARLEQASKRTAVAHIVEFAAVERESPVAIVLGQCMARGARMDTVMQKAVELGVSAIAPLSSRRCEVKLLGGRESGRLLHWQGVIISACEQCGRNRLPHIAAPQPLASWLPETDAAAGTARLVLDPGAPVRLGDLPPARRVILLSGPEGGLTADEVALAQRHGFVPIRLGPRVLRAETAPVAAIAAVQALWGDG